MPQQCKNIKKFDFLLDSTSRPISKFKPTTLFGLGYLRSPTQFTIHWIKEIIVASRKLNFSIFYPFNYWLSNNSFTIRGGMGLEEGPSTNGL